MKKTIIALMALAGVAFGANYTEPAESNPFTAALTEAAYVSSMNYDSLLPLAARFLVIMVGWFWFLLPTQITM